VVPEDKGKEIEVQRQDGEGPSTDLTNNHDFVSGIMKIVPSDVAVSITSVRGIFVFCICNLLGKSVSYVHRVPKSEGCYLSKYTSYCMFFVVKVLALFQI
jgi:hypothetical protein